jgi:hypothetical protein
MARKRISRSDLTKIAETYFKRVGIVNRENPAVQAASLTSENLQQLLGSLFKPESYLSNFEKTMRQYMNLVLEDNFKNLNPAIQKRFRELQSSNPKLLYQELLNLFSAENLDLSILNKATSSKIYNNYRTNALFLGNLIEKFGFPGLPSRSENAYRHLLTYEIDLLSSLRKGEQIHPFFLALMRTNFNIKDSASAFDDLSTGKNRIRNPMSLRNLVDRLSRIKRIEEVSDGKTTERFVNFLGLNLETEAFERTGKEIIIDTWDTETTGLTPESMVRSISVVRRKVRLMNDGTTEMVSAPEVIMSKHFRSKAMDAAHVYQNVYEEGNPVFKAVSLSERNAKKGNGSRRSWHSGIRKSDESFR